MCEGLEEIFNCSSNYDQDCCKKGLSEVHQYRSKALTCTCAMFATLINVSQQS